jgi:hypothetical protein
MASDSDAAYIAEVRAAGAGKSEDYARFSDAELLSWKKYYQGAGKFKNDYGDVVDKPDERGPNTPHNRNGTGDQGDFGWGWNDSGVGDTAPASAATPDAAPAATPAPVAPATTAAPLASVASASGTYGGAPAFTPPPDFVAPTYDEATADPGYQFALKEGQGALERSAAARGTLRTSGTLKDLIGYGQRAATQQYGNVYDRAVNDYSLKYGAAKDKFAPQYGSWQTAYAGDLSKWGTQYGGDLSKWTTQYGGDLSKWSTRYGGDLSKYLQKENNIYGLLSQPAPTY